MWYAFTFAFLDHPHISRLTLQYRNAAGVDIMEKHCTPSSEGNQHRCLEEHVATVDHISFCRFFLQTSPASELHPGQRWPLSCPNSLGFAFKEKQKKAVANSQRKHLWSRTGPGPFIPLIYGLWIYSNACMPVHKVDTDHQ